MNTKLMGRDKLILLELRLDFLLSQKLNESIFLHISHKIIFAVSIEE